MTQILRPFFDLSRCEITQLARIPRANLLHNAYIPSLPLTIPDCSDGLISPFPDEPPCPVMQVVSASAAHHPSVEHPALYFDIKARNCCEFDFSIDLVLPTMLLGRAVGNISNDQSGIVKIYGGTPGGEVPTLVDVNGTLQPLQYRAFNRTQGYITDGTWCLVERNQNGWYIISANQASGLLCQVYDPTPPGAGHVRAFGPGSQANLYVCDDISGIPLVPHVAITAWIRHFPVITGENVSVMWTGSVFTVVNGDFGIVHGLYTDSTTLTKGSSSMLFKIGLTSDDPTTGSILDYNVKTRMGDLPSNKNVEILRDKFGFYAVAGEC